MKTWLITGSNRGLGLAIARAALAQGYAVVAAARATAPLAALQQEYGDRVLAAELDVTSDAATQAVVDQALQRFGRIDVLVNNAGYGRLGWFETVSDAEIRDQFEVNLFGAMRVTRAVLPAMRAQRSGHVFTVSSIAGAVANAGGGIYASSKHAVEGWMEGLAGELSPLGIACTVIQPGYFRTDFLDQSSVRYGSIHIDDYAAPVAEFKSRLDGVNHQQQGDPDKLGALLCRLVAMDDPPVRIAVGSDAVQVVRDKAQHIDAEAQRLRALSESTDRDSVDA